MCCVLNRYHFIIHFHAYLHAKRDAHYDKKSDELESDINPYTF